MDRRRRIEGRKTIEKKYIYTSWFLWKEYSKILCILIIEQISSKKYKMGRQWPIICSNLEGLKVRIFQINFYKMYIYE